MNYYRYTYYFKSYIVKICCVQFHTDAMLEVSDIEKLPQCLVVHASTKLEKICKGIWIISKVVNFLRRDYSNLFVSKNTSNSPICISSVHTDVESKKKNLIAPSLRQHCANCLIKSTMPYHKIFSSAQMWDSYTYIVQYKIRQYVSSIFLFNLSCAIMSLIYRLAGSYLGNVHEVFHGILTTKGHFLKKFNAPFFIEKQV